MVSEAQERTVGCRRSSQRTHYACGMPVRNVRPPREDDENPRLQDVEALNDATRDCPKCGAVLHDDVDICWKCGHMLSQRDEKGLPTWALVTGAVLIVVISLLALF